jgi:hypothetical protein
VLEQLFFDTWIVSENTNSPFNEGAVCISYFMKIFSISGNLEAEHIQLIQ